MCTVQHGEMKSVFTFQPTNIPDSTIVKSAQPPLTCSIFVLRTKNRNSCCLVVMVFVGLQDKRGGTTKKTSPFLKKFLRQSQSNTPEPEPKKAKIIPLMA